MVHRRGNNRSAVLVQPGAARSPLPPTGLRGPVPHHPPPPSRSVPPKAPHRVLCAVGNPQRLGPGSPGRPVLRDQLEETQAPAAVPGAGTLADKGTRHTALPSRTPRQSDHEAHDAGRQRLRGSGRDTAPREGTEAPGPRAGSCRGEGPSAQGAPPADLQSPCPAPPSLGAPANADPGPQGSCTQIPDGSRAPESPALTAIRCSGPRGASLPLFSICPRPASPQPPAHGAMGPRGRETPQSAAAQAWW